MKQYLGVFVLTIVMLSCASVTIAQELDTTKLKENVDILSGVLRDGLGVNETPGLFGLNEARVDSVYLRGQGVIMDIQTPLARRRNRVNINALASSISRFSTRSNPFEAIRESNAPGANRTIALTLQQDPADTMYRTIIEEIQSIDVTTMIDSSIRQANTSARSLRELGELDQESFSNLQQELYSMREDLGSMRENFMRRIDELRQMENNPLEASAATPVESDLRANLEDLRLAVELLKVMQKAGQKILVSNMILLKRSIKCNGKLKFQNWKIGCTHCCVTMVQL